MSIQYKKYRKSYKVKMLKMLLSLDEEWNKTSISMYNTLEQMPNSYEKIYMALSDDIVIGFVYGFILPNKTLIPIFLYVDKGYRTQGVGTNLLKILEQESRCVCSLIWYEKSLHDFYKKQNYDSGGNLEVSMKLLTQND